MHGASHEVLGRLAVGGMAEIYLARTTHRDGRREIVVLKRILPHLSEDPEFVRMFRDEAYLAATLDHPNIVHVHDIGQDGEDYFFTMEYVHGENVRTIIKAAQKLEVDIPLQHVVQIALGVCEGLHYAHEQVDDDGSPLRIVHRDVSPTNILVSFEGEVKIVDFGIAKAAAATHVTQAGMLKGKASYMSPEQCRAEPVDRRSDVFAIGILVYEMTTLTRLFRGDNELAVLHQILTGSVEPPSTRVDDYPPDLERIVMRALAQRPDDRYPTAQAMREDLEELVRSRGLQPSTEALGEYLRELCGERPHPWDEEDEDLDEDELAGAEQSGTGMPTSLGHFEDEEDTQVNRRAPNLRTLIPGAPSEWDAEEPEEPTGTTNRRMLPDRGAAPRSVPKAGAPARTGPRPGGRLRLPGKGMPARRSEPAPDEPEPGHGEPTTPMVQPAAARSAPRGPGSRPSGPALWAESAPTRPTGNNLPRAQPFGAAPPIGLRSGRTLPGAGGGLAGPGPARSGRTVPGNGQSPLAGGANPSMGPRGGPSASPPLGGTTDRTATAGAGSRPRVPAGQARPGRRPSGFNEAVPPETPGTADRTMALTPEQARAIAQAGASASPPVPSADAWSGPGVGRTELATPLHAQGPYAQPRPGDVDEGARTIALGRFDRTMLAGAADRELPQGPMRWGGAEDPLPQAQRSTPLSGAEPASLTSLTSTQKSPISMPPTAQRSPSAAYPLGGGPLGGGPLDGPASAGFTPVGMDLRRPEMRSPSPRPASTPRSLWVPVLIVLIVGLAGTAVWLWLRNARAATPADLDAPATQPVDRAAVQ